jgi:WD40 repeat protein
MKHIFIFRLPTLLIAFLFLGSAISVIAQDSDEGYPQTASAIDWRSDNKIAVGYSKRRLDIIDGQTSEVRTMAIPYLIASLAWSPDVAGNLLAFSGAESPFGSNQWGQGVFVVFDTATGQEIINYNEYSGIGLPTWSPDGRLVAAIVSPRRNEYFVAIWDTQSGNMSARFETTADNSIAWNPANADLMAFGDSDGRITVASLSQNSIVFERQLPTGESGIYFDGLKWSADGTLLAAGGFVHVWEVATGNLIFAETNPKGAVYWSPDGRFIAVLGVQEITVLRLNDKAILYTSAREHPYKDIAWSPDGKKLVYTTKMGVNPNGQGVAIQDISIYVE